MLNFINLCFMGLVAAVLLVILLVVIWCVLIPGFIIFAIKVYKFFDKLSDKLYSKFKTKE